MIYISHKMAEIRQIADDITIMREWNLRWLMGSGRYF